MFCLASLIVLGILSIFSASHRPLARLALDCVLRRATFRPCNSDFPAQIQGRVVGALFLRSPAAARFVHRRFELLAWIFVLLSVVSLAWALWGGFNFYAYGSCNGRNAAGFCAFDPKGENNAISSISEECRETPPTDTDLLYAPLVLAKYPTLHKSGAKEFVVIGDYGCDFTRKAWPVFKSLRENRPDMRFVFVQFPVKKETAYLSDYATCAAVLDIDKFFTMSDFFFARTKEDLQSSTTAMRLVGEAGFDVTAFEKCLVDPATAKATTERKKEVKKTGLYGTPTVFINGRTPFVGPKPMRVYTRALRGTWW